MGQDPNRHDRHHAREDDVVREGAHRVDRDLTDEELIPEGSGKQFARGVGDDHVDERLVVEEPSEILHGERVPEGSGKQFARGVGEDTSAAEGERIPEGSGKQYGRGVARDDIDDRLGPAEPAEDLHGEHVPEGSGKQYARDYPEDVSDEERRRD